MPEAPIPGGRRWSGRWCWTRKHLSRPWNYYALFRRVVDLPGKPGRAIVRVSADARYTLYVNGKRIHQGPARSYPQFQGYDTLDIAGALDAGANTICAIVHQFGVPTFQSVYRDLSGFLMDGAIEVGEQSFPVDTPEGWVCRDAQAWRKDVVRLSVQLGFQEHFDATRDPADWMTPQAVVDEAHGWAKPFDIGPVGSHPWIRMEERGAALLADHPEQFASVVGLFSGENARGYKIADDVYHLALGETRKSTKAGLENPQAMLRDDAELTTLLPPPEGSFLMAVLDLGQTRTGHIRLDIAEAAGDEIIDILYTEMLDKTGAPALLGLPTISICEEATADRYRCRPGQQYWEPFWYKGMRYATLVFRNVTKPLKIRHVGLRQVHASLVETGAFACSDQVLNDIWRVGRETLRNCMFDAYVDCPWREQAQWWGDARVQFRVNSYIFGDVGLLERGIRQVAQSQAPDGSLHSHPPADSPMHRLPDYMMTWVGSLWDYHFHTGRTELLKECLDTITRLFEFFAEHEGKEGLIGNFDGWWVFLDWQNLYKANYSGVLNLMYLQALRWAAAVCQVVEQENLATAYMAKAAALSAAVQKAFWDGKAKVWRDAFDPAMGTMLESTSQHMNALAILLRLRPENHSALAKDVLLKPAASKRGKVLTASPFFYAYVLDALIEAGLKAEAIGIIRDKWGQMIAAGATTFWEIWEPTRESRCHAWSASPVYHLSQQVLGVTPVEVGWKQVLIAPVPGKLEFARGVVPSPLGPIKVEWEKAAEDQLAVRIDIPQGMQADFAGPLGETRTLAAGGHEFHT